MNEQELREQIAKEIEAEMVIECGRDNCHCDTRNTYLEFAANIIRGQK